jgi:16S rRNA G966 N2-methylase RsmD
MRIIAGKARGRQIEAPEGRNTRPTLDRVRENLFNILQMRIRGASVLDLFA